MTARNWCFTLNNYSDKQLADLSNVEFLDKRIKGIVFQQEVGQTGTPHIQGYVELTTPVRIKQARKILPGCGGAHFERRLGTRSQAIAYCSKEETKVPGTETQIWGTCKVVDHMPGQGKRTDIEDALHALRAAECMGDLWDTHGPVFVKYPRGMANAQMHYAPGRDPETRVQVHVHWGDAGSGKSFHVRERYANRSYYAPTVGKDGRQWYDGYEGQEVLVFEDYDQYCCMSFPQWKRLCDDGEFSLPTKGGFLKCAATLIVFTSNEPPCNWYKQLEGQHRIAFNRRIHHIFHWKMYEGNRPKPPKYAVLTDGDLDGIVNEPAEAADVRENIRALNNEWFGQRE